MAQEATTEGEELKRRSALVALLLIAAVGLGSSAVALAWKPEAYARDAAGRLYCDRGIGMWLWGISSGGRGRGPLSGGNCGWANRAFRRSSIFPFSSAQGLKRGSTSDHAPVSFDLSARLSCLLVTSRPVVELSNRSRHWPSSAAGDKVHR
jgi:hypothetical protein